MPHCQSRCTLGMITLIKSRLLLFTMRVRMPKNGLLDGVGSPPTEGGGSLDWLQIITLFECLISQNLKKILTGCVW
jgi:hypothetical protein